VFPKIDRLAKRQPGVEVVQRDGGPGKCLDQRNLDRRELVVAAEISLDGANEPIKLLRGVGATVEQVSREQLRPGLLMGCFRRPACILPPWEQKWPLFQAFQAPILVHNGCRIPISIPAALDRNGDQIDRHFFWWQREGCAKAVQSSGGGTVSAISHDAKGVGAPL
jgi:hypothetical protein